MIRPQKWLTSFAAVFLAAGICAAKARAPASPVPGETSVQETSVPVEDAPSTPAPVDVKGLPGLQTASLSVSPGAKVQRVWIWQETNDCLWNMARENYGDPFQWRRIYEANRSVIKDPNVIFPKQQIVIPPMDGAALPVTVPPDVPEPGPAESPAEGLPGVPAAPVRKSGAAPKRSGEEAVLDEYRWNETRGSSTW